MIVNGDFAAGNAGFTSGYGVDCIAPPTTGSYCVGATAGAVNPFWWLQAGNPVQGQVANFPHEFHYPEEIELVTKFTQIVRLELTA